MELFCPSCGVRIKNLKDLYDGTSDLYKYYKKIIYCKKCISNIYEKYFEKYNDEKLSIYYLCRKLDIPFSQGAYSGAVQNSKKRNWKIYSSYLTQVNSLGGSNSYGSCFDDGEFLEDKKMENEDKEQLKEIDDDIIIFWGKGFDFDDYVFLEMEISNWKKTHKCDNQAELVLLREICITILQIRKLREQVPLDTKEIKELQKNLQDLMKTASVDPAKANAASAGKFHDTYGVWIKDIEQFKPAEWHDKQDKYKDMDGFLPYIQNYIVRPIRNFVTGNRDFRINDNINVDIEEESD